MNKEELRRQLLEKRRAMLPEEVESLSAAIRGRLKTLEVFRDAPQILTYVSSRDNEVDTCALIQELLGAGRVVLAPKAFPSGIMQWRRLEGLETLIPGRFGIFEPPESCPAVAGISPAALCLTPGIAFSTDGYRIGYGGGYFDRFLAGFSGTAVGLAYEFQITDDFRSQPHDRPVQWIITEERVIRCAEAPGR